MHRFIFLLSLASCCFGYQSLNVPQNASATMTVPSVYPFTAMGDYRIAFRLHNWSTPHSGQVTLISFEQKATIVLNAAGQLCGFDWVDTMTGYGNAVCVSVSGLTDVVARMQRFGSTYPVSDSAPGSTWFEVQDLSSGNILTYECGGWSNTGCPINAANTVSFAGTASGLGGTAGFSVAWLKWFSSTVTPGSPMENENTPAELADWRFEGNYLNQGTGGYAVTLSAGSGGPSFMTSPVKAPACNLARQVFRAGTFAQLSNTAYPLDGSTTLQYLWQELSGPTRLLWAGQNTSQPTVSGGVFGSYVLQLAVTEGSGQTSTCSIKDGFVATDAKGVVVSANPSVDILLGPQVQLGKNPWGWFDDRHVAEAALQTANLTKYYNLGGIPPWNTAGPGTIATTNNSAIITGSGTTFKATFCQGGSSPPPEGSIIVIWYPNSAVLEGSGRRQAWVQSCQSDTQLTLTGAWNSMGFLTAGSGWNYAWVDGNVWNTWFANAAPANFYDVVAALYSLYYRSGIDDYLNTARLFADNFWQFRLDSGRNYFYGEGYNTFPRNRSVLGMTLRALDGRPDMWSGLELIANLNISSYHATFQNYGPWTQIQGDPRENGYELLEESYVALFDPNSTAAAAARSGISEVMGKGWQASQFPDGNWYSLYWGGMGGGPTVVDYSSWSSGTCVSLTHGSSVATCVNGASCGNGNGICGWTEPVTGLSAPGTPTLGEVSGPGGTNLPATTYYVVVTYVGGTGESAASAESSHRIITTNNILTVASPSAASGVTGYNVYVGTYSGGEQLQTVTPLSIGTNWTENNTGLAPGRPSPVYSEFSYGSPTAAQPWWFTNNPTAAPGHNADGDAVAYYPVFVDNVHVSLQDINGNTVPYQGSTGIHGWVVGYLGAVGFAVQPYMEGILATGFDFAAKAMACTSADVPHNCDNGVAGLAHQFNVQAANYLKTTGYWLDNKGMWYFAGAVNCTPPLSDTNAQCGGENNVDASRILNSEALRGVMTAYAYNGDPDLVAFGDTLYTAMWGRPGFALPSGQASDGAYNSGYNDGFGWFMTGAPPVGAAHKYFGMGWGISAGSAWPGYRLGGAHVGSMVESSIAVNLGSVPQAVAFNILATYLTGSSTAVHCSSSPCSISFDQLQGNPIVQIQYLSASGAVLASQPYSSPIWLN